MRRRPVPMPGWVAAAALVGAMPGCIPAGPVAMPLPAVPVLLLDSALRGAQGTATIEYDVWKLVEAMPEWDRGPGEKRAIEVLIERAVQDLPRARGRLRARDSGTLVLRTRPDLATALDAWLDAEHARYGLPRLPSKAGAPW